MNQPAINIYTLSTCSHCKATKAFFSECSVDFTFTDVDLLKGDERTAAIEAVKKINPRCSFPTIIIGDRIIIGFREGDIREALGL